MYFSKILQGTSAEELDSLLGGFLNENPGIEIRSVTQSESVDLAHQWNITMSIIYTTLFSKFDHRSRGECAPGLCKFSPLKRGTGRL